MNTIFNEGKNNEVILFKTKKHWVFILKPTLFVISLLIIFTVLFSGLIIFPNDFPAIFYPLFLLFIVVLNMTIHWFFLKIFQWILSEAVITNYRVIDFHASPFIQNDVIYVKIKEVHEIERTKRGILANFLNYGDAHLNLAAVMKQIKIKTIPKPEVFIDYIEAIRIGRIDSMLNSEVIIKILTEICRNNIESLLMKSKLT